MQTCGKSAPSLISDTHGTLCDRHDQVHRTSANRRLVGCRNEYKLHEKHIGPHLGERCVAVLSDPTTDLGRQAHAFTHHLADLSLDVVRAQQRVGSGAQERRPEGAPGPGDSVQRVPDAIDSQLLVRLEQEGIYRGPAP